MPDSAPGQVKGACCLPDDTCQELTQIECSNEGGIYRGDDTKCRFDTCQPLYRVVDLGDMGDFIPSDSDSYHDGKFGINNHGQVVYARDFNGETHAALWLPVAAYGFMNPGIYDLGETGIVSIARDININGLIIGQEGGISLSFYGPDPDKAALWTLSGGIATKTNPDGLDYSRGLALNDDAPVYYIGDRENTGQCRKFASGGGCDDGDGYTVLQSFRFDADGNPQRNELDFLDDTDHCHSSSVARDVNNSGLIVGYSYQHVFRPHCSGDVPELKKAGVYWDPNQNTPTELSVLTTPLTTHFEARGVNNNGEIVGWGPPTGGGLNKAYYWSSKLDASPDNLNAKDMPPDHPSGQNTRAEAINNLAEPHIIATNESSHTAMIWISQGNDEWEAYDLDDIFHDLDQYTSCFHQLREGHDINDSGWIVAWGDDSSDTGIQPHAYVLVPVVLDDCYCDLTGDDVVNIDDVFVVLGLWGDCEEGVIECDADVTFDCTVDIDDIFAILGNFRPCGGSANAGMGGGGGVGGEGDLLLRWLNAGGYAAIQSGRITWNQVEHCLTGESNTAIENCLNNLVE